MLNMLFVVYIFPNQITSFSITCTIRFKSVSVNNDLWLFDISALSIWSLVFFFPRWISFSRESGCTLCTCHQDPLSSQPLAIIITFNWVWYYSWTLTVWRFQLIFARLGREMVISRWNIQLRDTRLSFHKFLVLWCHVGKHFRPFPSTDTFFPCT